DGFFVRSPTKANGVVVAEAERRRFEDDYLKRARAREGAGGSGAAAPGVEEPAPAVASPASGPTPADVEHLVAQTRQPGFVDSAYFLRFKFEQGTYAFVGHETFDGRDVLRVEYYPARLFSHEQNAQDRRRAAGTADRRKDIDAALEQMMNKVALVTLWIEPKAHQIVKYTFDNVSLDFLPLSWLLRVDDLKATMTMSQPFPDVWLPRDIDMAFGAMLAIGAIDATYHVDYSGYREATTAGRFVIPDRNASPSPR
ncbi:MAG: hypothetical protein ABI652_05370, partial [Acidobacteriota bacterium]